MSTVYIPIKRITDGGGFPVCWDSNNGYCPFFDNTTCTFDGYEIVDDKPHATCPVWSKDAITLQALPVVACGEVN